MADPRYVQSFDPEELGLEGSLEGEIVAFSVPKKTDDGSGVMVHTGEMLRRMAELPARVAVIVFLDEPAPDNATLGQIRDMLTQYAKRKAHALVRHVAATEAVKRIEDGLVAEGVDRSSLVAVRSPEIIDRSILEKALAAVNDRMVASPTALVAAVGGVIALFDTALTSQETSR